MRTRLDEIVEEETRQVYPGAGAPRGGYLHRIAERAYQEGIAAALIAEWEGQIKAGVLTGLHVSGKDVEPAPVEAEIAGWVWPVEWHDRWCLEQRYPPPCVCGKNDRRKGERRVDNSRYDARTDCYTSMRPGGEARMHTHATGLGRSGDGPVYEWLPNRRRQNRRKP